MKKLILLLPLLLLGCNNGSTIHKSNKQYTVYCLDGVSYAVFNENLNYAMMSVMLDKESKIIPCEGGNN